VSVVLRCVYQANTVNVYTAGRPRHCNIGSATRCINLCFSKSGQQWCKIRRQIVQVLHNTPFLSYEREPMQGYDTSPKPHSLIGVFQLKGLRYCRWTSRPHPTPSQTSPRSPVILASPTAAAAPVLSLSAREPRRWHCPNCSPHCSPIVGHLNLDPV
jgi:hypothetical protein